MNDLALQIENLSKSFRVARSRSGAGDPRRERLSWRQDRLWALRGVSFSIERGQTLGLIGPNGSGKSTLLKILSGVMTPESGHFTAQGRIGALLELGAGFHPDLTGLENVYLNGALLGLGSREVDRLLPKIISFAELERFMDMPIRHYSSGMTARLGFAVATQLAPDILLMDETFATGDARFQAKALDHIAMMKAQGRTMILVSHNMEMILHLADRVLWLDHGTVRRDGPTRDILAEYRRSQQLSLYAADRMRNALGMDSLFEILDPEPTTMRIESVALKVEGSAPDSPAKDATEKMIEIRNGESLELDLRIAHPIPHPPQAYVETAWVRDDNRILAQSRTPVTLEPDATHTRLSLKFGPWQLTEATWSLGVALSPLSPTVIAPNSSAPSSAGNPRIRHYDRKLHAAQVRVVTPQPFAIPIVMPIKSRWRV